MGSEEGDKHERPVHEVVVSRFRMSRQLVTNADYEPFIRDTGRKAPELWESGRVPTGAETHPVVYVSWTDAQAFCAWLTQAVGRPREEGRAELPTEAQWEFAARGPEGRRYPWGDERPTPERANFYHSRLVGISSVGSYPKGGSPEGVQDLAPPEPRTPDPCGACVRLVDHRAP